MSRRAATALLLFVAATALVAAQDQEEPELPPFNGEFSIITMTITDGFSYTGAMAGASLNVSDRVAIGAQLGIANFNVDDESEATSDDPSTWSHIVTPFIVSLVLGDRWNRVAFALSIGATNLEMTMGFVGVAFRQFSVGLLPVTLVTSDAGGLAMTVGFTTPLHGF